MRIFHIEFNCDVGYYDNAQKLKFIKCHEKISQKTTRSF